MISKEHNSRGEEHAWENWNKHVELFSKSLKQRDLLGHQAQNRERCQTIFKRKGEKIFKLNYKRLKKAQYLAFVITSMNFQCIGIELVSSLSS